MGCCGDRTQKEGVIRTATKFVSTLLGGVVEDDVMDSRMNKCILCVHKDIHGDRMLRVHKAALFCGKPRLAKVVRNESDEGCGCLLHSKVRYRDSKCPRGEW